MRPIINTFFGESVTVSGLICGQDLAAQLKGIHADAVIIVDDMLNSDHSMFLDDMTPSDLQSILGIPLLVCRNRGEAFYEALERIAAGEIKGDISYV